MIILIKININNKSNYSNNHYVYNNNNNNTNNNNNNDEEDIRTFFRKNAWSARLTWPTYFPFLRTPSNPTKQTELNPANISFKQKQFTVYLNGKQR